MTKISNLKLNEAESKIVKSRRKVETIRKMFSRYQRNEDHNSQNLQTASQHATLDFLKDPEKKRDKAKETIQIYAK